MPRHQFIELLISVLTLLLSIYVAYGPLRHRLPRFLSRLAKYSVALKLLILSSVCWWALAQNVHLHGSAAVRWMLVALGTGLIGGAIFVLSLKQLPRR